MYMNPGYRSGDGITKNLYIINNLAFYIFLLLHNLLQINIIGSWQEKADFLIKTRILILGV